MTKTNVRVKLRRARRSTQLPNKARRKVAPTHGRHLGVDARKHVELLEDPCNGALVHPVYPGSESGALMRFTNLVTVNTGAGNTSGALNWVPGNQAMEVFYTTNPTTNGTWTGSRGSELPGYNFFANNECTYRCVAACLEAFTTSSEMNRQGYMGFANAQDDTSTDGEVTTANTMLNLCSAVTRTPEKRLGIRWLPNANDTQYASFSNSAQTNNTDKSSLLFAWAGHQADVAIQLKLTAVYEVNFKRSGIPNVIHRNPSPNTMDDVTASFWQRNKDTLIDFSAVAVGAAVKWGTAAIMAA